MFHKTKIITLSLANRRKPKTTDRTAWKKRCDTTAHLTKPTLTPSKPLIRISGDDLDEACIFTLRAKNYFGPGLTKRQDLDMVRTHQIEKSTLLRKPLDYWICKWASKKSLKKLQDRANSPGSVEIPVKCVNYDLPTHRVWDAHEKDLVTGKVDLHYYKNLPKVGKYLNFTGKQRGYLTKAIKTITKVNEQFNQRQFIFYQPGGNKVRENHTTAYKVLSMGLNKSQVDPGVQFENFVVTTQPTLAFYPIKKRSFKKKRKIHILSHSLKIAKPHNRVGKLLSIIKQVYFRHKRRHFAGDTTKNMLNFCTQEILYTPNNPTYKGKLVAHERIGRDSVNEIIFRRRLEKGE